MLTNERPAVPRTLFISDLHLAAAEPATTQTFLRFMQDIAPQAEALYVLGDLFEYWLGDDSLDEPLHRSVVGAFARFTADGTPLFFMHGNRDFLLGQTFFAATGGTLLTDALVKDLYGAPTLLMHGDTLCTDDVDYQRFRAMVRAPAWQASFLARPLAERQAMAEGLRGTSEEAKRAKSAAIMDVSLPTVDATLRSHAYPRLIHGHTHRPARHVHVVDGRECERWVISDWYAGRGGYLVVGPEGCEARSL